MVGRRYTRNPTITRYTVCSLYTYISGSGGASTVARPFGSFLFPNECKIFWPGISLGRISIHTIVRARGCRGTSTADPVTLLLYCYYYYYIYTHAHLSNDVRFNAVTAAGPYTIYIYI